MKSRFKNLTCLDLNDTQLELLDRALNAVEDILLKFPIGKSGLAVKSLPVFVASAFAEHVRLHLVTELKNISDHGHRNDDPDDEPQPSIYARLTDLAKRVANSSYSDWEQLQREANKIVEEA